MPPRTLHRCRVSLAVLTLLSARCGLAAAQALPSNGQVVSGDVRIAPAAGPSLDVVQRSQRAIINWDSFSVDAGSQVRFVQPSVTSATLNRVVGSTPSTIAGQIHANGQVFLVNPNGIAITRNGTVDVGGGFVASTMDIGNADFEAGLLRFFRSGTPARITQDGTIRAQPGGTVALLGGSVSNSGLVAAPLGKIMVGSGEMATLDLHGDGMLQVALPGATPTPEGTPRIDIGGTLQADGGRIWVGAATTVEQAWRDVVNVSGEIVARSVTGRDGQIVLEAGPGGIVNVSGQLTASGDRSAGDIRIGGAAAHVDGTHAALIARSENGQGGSITLAPQAELTLGSALFDVSGATGGGSIRLGGDAYGAGSLVHAQRSSIAPDTRLLADATQDGDGGRVIVWSDARTEFLGQISARGAGAQGAGGFAEVSSHGALRFAGMADLRGAPGRAGTLLLDPFDVTISSAPNSNHDASFTANGNDSVVNVTTLQNALATANVTVSTGSGGTQAGDITVASPVAWSSGNRLTLSAARDINVNANVTSNGGSLTLNAGRGVSIAGATINTAGGNLIATTNSTDGTSGVRLDGATIDVGTGTGTLTGNSDRGRGVRFLDRPSRLRASGAGSITLTGNSTSSHGVVVETDLTTSGRVTINGSSSSAFGLDFHGTAITSSGNLAFSGTSDTSNAVWVLGNTLSLSTTGSGVISVQGTSSDLNGIRLNSGAALTTSGTVQLSGTSLSGGGGFSLVGSNTLTVNSGNTTIAGTAASGFNAIDMASSGNSVANNGTGTLALAGNGNISLAAPVTSSSGSLAINTTGDLTLAGGTQISWSPGGTQILNAGRDINVNAAINASGSLQLNAGRHVAVNSDITSSGGPLNVALTASAGGAGSVSIVDATIATGGGNLTASATQTDGTIGLLLSGATLNVGSGTGTLTGRSASGSGIFLIGASQALVCGCSGSLTLNGDSTSGNGVTFDGSASLATTGSVTLSGVSGSAVGLYLLGSNTLSAAEGALALSGTSSSNTGVWLNDGTYTLSSVGAGTISLAGSSSTRGIGLNSNVAVAGAGNVSVSGTGGSGAGIWLNGSNRLAQSDGSLLVSGTSNTGAGIWFDSGANSLNQSGTGSITVNGFSDSFAGLLANTNTGLSTRGTVSVSATSTSGAGMLLTGNNVVAVNSGAATWSAASGSGNGVQVGGNLILASAGTLAVSGSTASAVGMNLASGAALSSSGAVTLNGTATASAGRGVQLDGNAVTLTGSGSLAITGSAVNGAGVQFSNTNSLVNAAGTLSFNGISSAGSGVAFVDGAAMSSSGNIAVAGTSSSSSGVQFGLSTLSHATGDLTLTGNSGTSTSMLLTAGSTVANTGSGTLHVDGATGIALGGSISSPNGPLWLSAGGEVTQSAGSVTAANLHLSGAGATYRLEARGNQVQTLTADTGSVALHSASDLTIGTAPGSPGATTTGSIDISSDGDLTIAAGAAVTGASPVLAAGGNFINRSGPAAVSASSGRWLIYAADPATSTFGALDSGNTALWNATYASRPAGGVTASGNRYLFALQPALTVTSTGTSKVYGDDASSAIAGNYTVTGMHGGVENAFQGDTAASAYGGLPSVDSAGSAATAGVAGSPYSVVVSQGTLSSPAGYGFAFASAGQLSVTPRPLVFVAEPAARPYGQANPSLQGNVMGLASFDTLGNAANGTPVWTTTADPSSLPGTYPIVGGGLSGMSANYVLMQHPANESALSIAPRTAISIAPPPEGSRASPVSANSQAYCVLGPLLTRSEQTRCKLDADTVRIPVLQEQEAELP